MRRGKPLLSSSKHDMERRSPKAVGFCDDQRAARSPKPRTRSAKPNQQVLHAASLTSWLDVIRNRRDCPARAALSVDHGRDAVVIRWLLATVPLTRNGRQVQSVFGRVGLVGTSTPQRHHHF